MKALLGLVLVCVFLTFLELVFAFQLSPIVRTKTGQIRGKLVQNPAARQDVYQFTAIPFAEPPVGELRFKKPVPKIPWMSVLTATELAKSCIQYEGEEDAFSSLDEEGLIKGVQQSEDCLFLNIWVPRATLDAVTSGVTTIKPLSVYVFIHGGSFIAGTTMMETYNGTMMSGYDNIIFVSIQYRVGPLGFAYFGNTPNATANAGLWDQLAAMKWISENIGAFGGNSSEITIGGESAGAASVTYHLLSPYSRPYFQRAIVESGTAIADWAYFDKAGATEETNGIIGRLSSCSRGSRSSVAAKLGCLRSADPKSLESDDDLAPVIDGDFVPRDPKAMLLSGDFYKVPLLIGFTRDEGTQDLIRSEQATAKFNSRRNLTYKDYDSLVEIGYSLLTGEDDYDAEFLNAIRQHYRPVRQSRSEIVDAVIQATGDYGLTCPTYLWANQTAARSSAPVFAYHFTQKFLGEDIPAWMGSYHSLELNYVFGEPFASYASDMGYTRNDKLFSQALMEFWGNFIKTGNPGSVNVPYSNCNGTARPNTTPVKRTWPAYIGNSCRNQIIELNSETQVYTCREAVTCNVKANDCSFWAEKYFFKVI